VKKAATVKSNSIKETKNLVAKKSAKTPNVVGKLKTKPLA
jgi:hypothetical protein